MGFWSGVADLVSHPLGENSKVAKVGKTLAKVPRPDSVDRRIANGTAGVLKQTPLGKKDPIMQRQYSDTAGAFRPDGAQTGTQLRRQMGAGALIAATVYTAGAASGSGASAGAAETGFTASIGESGAIGAEYGAGLSYGADLSTYGGSLGTSALGGGGIGTAGGILSALPAGSSAWAKTLAPLLNKPNAAPPLQLSPGVTNTDRAADRAALGIDQPVPLALAIGTGLVLVAWLAKQGKH